jgi:hypothetical protein
VWAGSGDAALYASADGWDSSKLALVSAGCGAVGLELFGFEVLEDLCELGCLVVEEVVGFDGPAVHERVLNVSVCMATSPVSGSTYWLPCLLLR